MALPGENGTRFPEAYLTKVPPKIQRRDDRIMGTTNSDSIATASKLLDLLTKLIIHEDEILYFDYGAVRLGWKPDIEDHSRNDPRPVCVGLGWLPGWTFTMSERGVPDIIPAHHSNFRSPKSHDTPTKTEETEPGVLGLLYKLKLEGQPNFSQSFFQKKTAVDVKDLVYARAKDWRTAIDFHNKHKLMKQTGVYLQLLHGEIGHKYQKDGTVVPFRLPGWPVKAVLHIDPPASGPLIRTKKTIATERRVQGDWVAKELRKWAKEAGLPQAYVEEVLQKWITADPGTALKRPSRVNFKKFLGFR